MKLDGKRIRRTAIQAAAGAGAGLITAVSTDWSWKGVILALVQFVGTVISAILMNIEKQAKEGE